MNYGKEPPITSDMIEHLKKPFQPRDHGFKPRNQQDRANGTGYLYLHRHAIEDRLDAVEPGWSYEISDPIYRDDRVTFKATITIRGKSRSDYGSAQIVTNKSGDEVNQLEKAGATDAFRRAAAKWGIGRYIKSAPATVNNQTDLYKWLTALSEEMKASKAS